jgi:hypothetical protein
MDPQLTRTLFAILFLAMTAVLLPACASAECCTEGEDESVALASLPAYVQATILAYAGDRPVTEIEHEFENGTELYCVEVGDEDEVEFHVALDGEFLGYDDEEDYDDDEDHRGGDRD